EERVRLEAGQDGRDREALRVQRDALAVLSTAALRREPVGRSSSARRLSCDGDLHALGGGEGAVLQLEVDEMNVELALGIQIRPREEAASSGERHLGAASSGELAQYARDRGLLRRVVQVEHVTLAHAGETGLHLGKERLARA